MRAHVTPAAASLLPEPATTEAIERGCTCRFIVHVSAGRGTQAGPGLVVSIAALTSSANNSVHPSCALQFHWQLRLHRGGTSDRGFRFVLTGSSYSALAIRWIVPLPTPNCLASL
jgi:cation transport regulator ChaC